MHVLMDHIFEKRFVFTNAVYVKTFDLLPISDESWHLYMARLFKLLFLLRKNQIK